MSHGYEDWGFTNDLKPYEQMMREGSAYCGYHAYSPVPGGHACLILWNPPDSGVYILLKDVMARSITGGVGVIGTVNHEGSVGGYSPLNRYLGGPSSSVELRYKSHTTWVGDQYYGYMAPADEWVRVSDIFLVIPPGYWIGNRVVVVNSQLETIWTWFEVTDY